MSDSMAAPARDALTREWMDVATRARTRYVRRVLVTSALVLLMALGLMQLGNVLLWAARTATWGALIPVGLHALGIAIAIGWPARAGTSLLTPVQGFKGQVARRFADRAERLRALRTVVTLESALLFAWPLVRFVASGETPRWGVTFTTAVCSLAILWPLHRITDAQRAESRRLLGVEDREVG